jgi:plastocyanin
MHSNSPRLVAMAIAIAPTSFLIGSVAWPFSAAIAAPSAVVIHIDNFTFKQPVLKVKPGTTVTWVNGDDIPHNVVAKYKSFRSKVLDTGDNFSFTFAKPGEYEYFCALHPHMTGKVIVGA